MKLQEVLDMIRAIGTEPIIESRDTLRIVSEAHFLSVKNLMRELFGSKEVGFAINDDSNWYVRKGYHQKGMYVYLPPTLES